MKAFAWDSCVTEWLWACYDSLCWRRARFKRSNSVTASVQADLDPEGFPGLSIAVPTQDKSLQFGCSFQRHSSEPESASQYTECHRTVHTQGQWAYREVGLKWCAFRAFCFSQCPVWNQNSTLTCYFNPNHVFFFLFLLFPLKLTKFSLLITVTVSLWLQMCFKLCETVLQERDRKKG